MNKEDVTCTLTCTHTHKHTNTHMTIIQSWKKKGNPAISNNVDKSQRHYAKWNKSDIKTNTVWDHLYVESKNTKLIETESRVVVTRGW